MSWMDWILSLNWSYFFIKLAVLLVITPIMGFLILRILEAFEKAWKTKEKRKRWQACALGFFALAVAFGWF